MRFFKKGDLGKTLFLIFLIFAFIYFRLPALSSQTVPYTFDQGRDFLKVAEMVDERNPTFIGPATGTEGVFHGVWWYYFLTPAYLIFQGAPIGFYYFILAVFLIFNLLFFYFLAREFDFFAASFFFLLVAASPYFIKISLFPISSYFTLPFILLFFYSFYSLLKTKKDIWVFFIFFSLASIFEAELPTGVFLIPAFWATAILTRKVKTLVGGKRKIIYSFIGSAIPSVPRFLFEIKNGFLQSRNVAEFVLSPAKAAGAILKGAFLERLKLFWHYYLSIFPSDSQSLAIIFLFFFVFALLYTIPRLEKTKRFFTVFSLILLVILFLFTLPYRKSFWANYLEGLSYFYALLITVSLYSLRKHGNVLSSKIPTFLFLILFLFVISQLSRVKKQEKISGLAQQTAVLDFIYDKVGQENFCLRIYTPPVIPYTYRYIVNWRAKKQEVKRPVDSFAEGECWYVIESDQYQFRIDKWREENIPDKAQRQLKKELTETVLVEMWQLQ